MFLFLQLMNEFANKFNQIKKNIGKFKLSKKKNHNVRDGDNSHQGI